MRRKKQKPKQQKPYFSRKGDSEDFDYLRSQNHAVFLAAGFLLLIVWLVDSGIVDWFAALAG